jgi:hypothetical protein
MYNAGSLNVFLQGYKCKYEVSKYVFFYMLHMSESPLSFSQAPRRCYGSLGAARLWWPAARTLCSGWWFVQTRDRVVQLGNGAAYSWRREKTWVGIKQRS